MTRVNNNGKPVPKQPAKATRIRLKQRVLTQRFPHNANRKYLVPKRQPNIT
jgi:hypothetical protein